jgi:heme/copper-type cytochrome/quinol oxidase subunit 2
MILLNATAATYTFYALLFSVFIATLLYGCKILYQSIQSKDEAAIRRAKFILMFAIIALVSIGIVCFAITGKLPVN